MRLAVIVDSQRGSSLKSVEESHTTSGGALITMECSLFISGASTANSDPVETPSTINSNPFTSFIFCSPIFDAWMMFMPVSGRPSPQAGNTIRPAEGQKPTALEPAPPPPRDTGCSGLQDPSMARAAGAAQRYAGRALF